jgi:hypothetical protein
VAEATDASAGSPELMDLDELSMRNRGDDELCDTLLRLNRNRMLTQIDQNNFDLTPVIGIDRAGRVHHREALLERAATSGPYLSFKPWRNFNRNSRGDGGAVKRRQNQRFVQRRHQVYPRGLLALIIRQGPTKALNFYDGNNQGSDGL